MKRPTPRLDEKTAAFFTERHPSMNAAAEFWLTALPTLQARTLHEMRGRFTEDELHLILDVMNGVILSPQIAGQHVRANVADGIALDRLDKKWEIDGKIMVQKIAELSHFEAACLEVWATGFWQGTRESAGDGPGPADMEDWMRPLLANDAEGKGGTK